jgi:hypothetical protein
MTGILCAMAGARSADPNPDAFSFTNATNAEPSALTTSNTITPVGYDAPASWSVTNSGQGSVNGGTYASSGTISAGQTFTVRGTGSASYSTSNSFLVSIGTTQSTWSIGTRAIDSDPNAFSFNNAGGAGPSTLTTSNTITPTGYETSTAWSVTNGGQGSVSGGAYASSGTISPTQTLTVRGTSSASYSTSNSFLVSIGATQSTWYITTMAMPTEASYTSTGTYSFIVPSGVTSVSVVSIGGGQDGSGGTYGAGGGGGGLNWRNNLTVTAGQSITIEVNAYRTATYGGNTTSGFLECSASGGQNSNGGGRSAPSGGGGQGGGGYYLAGGGGAAGYSGNGGGGNASNGSGGGGAGGTQGGSTSSSSVAAVYPSGGGGGVGIYGQGANGVTAGGGGQGGGGGSGGGNGSNSGGSGGSGGLYGGGGGAGGFYQTLDSYGYATSETLYGGGAGRSGACRIIWPGNTRQFPSTNTGAI